MIELNNEGSETNERQEDLELPLFDLDTILIATDNFSWNKKLGEGGFGPVYKVRICSSFLLTSIHHSAILMIFNAPNFYNVEF